MSPSHTVGCLRLDVTDPVQGVPIPTWVLHPASAATRPVRFGPYEVEVAEDVEVVGERLPIVALSHGNGGSPWTHRETARHLARAGFVVALLEHPGNGRSDNSLAFTAANLANRPRHVRLVLDALIADPRLAPHVDASSVSIVGHSIGAYTALALAGGRPTSLPAEEPDFVARPVSVERDPRVRALVLLAPAAVWYREPGSLADVDAWILMRTGEHDEHAPPIHRAIVLGGLPRPERIDERIVPNAGHFSFQSPFPPAMTRPDFPPSQDPPGFDRAAYQPVLNAEIEAFLRRSASRDAG